MIKKIILALLFLSSVLNSQSITLNLVDFALQASKSNNVSILVDDTIREHNFSFFVNENQKITLEAFSKALESKHLKLKKYNKFYFVSKMDYQDIDIRYRTVKLDFVKFEDIANFLNVFSSTAQFEFIQNSKLLLVKSNQFDFEAIKNVIKMIDYPPKMYSLHITLLDTNLDNLKNLGNFESNYNISPDNKSFFFNLISYPFSVSNTLPIKEKNQFYTFMKALQSTNTTEYLISPTLTLTDGKETTLSVGQNMPFLNGETNYNNNSTTSTNSYDYKDVGINIVVKPTIYSQGNVYLDLELNVSNILSNENNLPITNKKFIKQQIHLTTDNLVFLTGLNKKEFESSTGGVPLLKDIPFLGWFFKYENKSEKNNNLTIILELRESSNGF